MLHTGKCTFGFILSLLYALEIVAIHRYFLVIYHYALLFLQVH